jgi:WhiB family transcriptional regulator, redox-sensing transcriptional regulator
MIPFERGACRDLDPAVLHPDLDAPLAVDRARAVCARCELRRECLAFALRTDGLDGVWGGLTAIERARYPRADFASMMRRR